MEAKICGEQFLAMFLYVTANLVQLGRAEAIVHGRCDGLEPELRFKIIARDVNVRRLVVFPAVEMKPVGTDAKDGGHGGEGIVRRRGIVGKQAPAESSCPAPVWWGHVRNPEKAFGRGQQRPFGVGHAHQSMPA